MFKTSPLLLNKYSLLYRECHSRKFFTATVEPLDHPLLERCLSLPVNYLLQHKWNKQQKGFSKSPYFVCSTYAKAFAWTVDTARKCILRNAVHQSWRKKSFHGAHDSNNWNVALAVPLNFLGQCWYTTTTVRTEHFQSARQGSKKEEKTLKLLPKWPQFLNSITHKDTPDIWIFFLLFLAPVQKSAPWLVPFFLSKGHETTQDNYKRN